MGIEVCKEMHINALIDHLTHNQHKWFGNVLVVKHGRESGMTDVLGEDVEFATKVVLRQVLFFVSPLHIQMLFQVCLEREKCDKLMLKYDVLVS